MAKEPKEPDDVAKALIDMDKRIHELTAAVFKEEPPAPAPKDPPADTAPTPDPDPKPKPKACDCFVCAIFGDHKAKA